MSMLTKDGNFPSTSCVMSQEAQESSFTGQSPISALKVTLLSSEWRSTKGSLSTINRELAIQLAKHSNVEVSMYLPQCSEEDKRAAAAHNVCIIEAEEIPGYDPIDWLATIPRDHQMDFVIGHGIHLGRQVPHIKRVHQGCKWIQVVHTDPEELGMFKNYADSIAKGEKKHEAEVSLCKLADQVVAIGPKLEEAFSRYLRSCGKDQDVLNLTPGIFSEFADVPQAAEERGSFRVLVFGRGDIEDFKLKGYDIAARAVAELCKHEPHCFKLAFVGAPKGEEEKVKELLLKESIASSQLIVRSYKEREQLAAQFCEADLAIMPSRTEGFGLAALEALSAGLPVLVSGNCGIGDALKKLPFGSSCVVNSEDASEWAKAIRAVHDKKRKLRLREAVKLCEGYAEEYQWEAECGRLVERMLNIIQVSSEGRSVLKQGRRPLHSHPIALPPVKEQRRDTDTRRVSSEGRSVVKQGNRPLHLHPSARSPVKQQRRDTDIRRVFSHYSVVVKLLRAEYNRRAQLKPLFWDSTTELPLEEVYTRLKIVPRQKPGDQTKPKHPYDALRSGPFFRGKIEARAQADEVNPCDIFGFLKKGGDVMTIIEGSPGIGKTTFCLKLANEWANQSSSAASFPEYELVLLLKCRDIEGNIKEAITEQLFPKDMSKDAKEELFHFMEDIKNQERVLIILDGLDELAEKSKHFVDDLLHRKRWACCYVLATTRQEKGIEVRKQPEFVFNLFLRIEGFTREDSFEYIRRHFRIACPEHSSKGEELIEEIEENSLLLDLQTNPLNLLLLCVVYEDHEGELPSSRTDLYHVIVVCLLRRYCAKHHVKASKNDSDLETRFERDIRCLGELALNCLLNDRHSFSEEELEELESRNEELVVRELGFVYKEESLKRLKPQHEYCFLHKSFQEYLAASYIAHKLRRNEFNVFEHLNFNAVVNKFRQVFVFVCGILCEEASILFAQLGEKLKSNWDWLKCSEEEADFFFESWSESGNAERMANTLCSFMPFPPEVRASYHRVSLPETWNLVRVLLFCRRFSKLKAPDGIYLNVSSFVFPASHVIEHRDFASLPNLKSLDLSSCDMNVNLADKIFQILPDFASLTNLALPDLPEMTDWEIAVKGLKTSKTLQTVECFLLGERGKGWARALDAGLCADTPLSSLDLGICGPMNETALQALENLLSNKSLSSVSVTVKGDMSHSLAVTLERCLTGQTVVKSLELRVNGKLSFCGANLIEQGIAKNNTLSELVVSLAGELPDNWCAIAENLNVQLAEKSNFSFESYPNTFSPVTATQLTDVIPCVKNYGFFETKTVTLNIWSELTVDGAEALYKILRNTWVCHLTLNIHGKVTDDFLHCIARYVDDQKPLCPITINTWDQLTNEGKALFKELELDKNSAVTLNVCEVHVPADESGDNNTVSIGNPASLITLLEEAEKNRKENLTVTINVQGDDFTFDDSDDSTGRSWNGSVLFGLARNCSLTSLILTMNNFSPRSTELSFILISFLESCISLRSLDLTLNEYNNDWEFTFASRLRKALGRNTSLISLNLTLNIFTCDTCFGFDDISDDDAVPNISVNSFTLTINDFTITGYWRFSSSLLWSNYKSLNTFNLTLNYWYGLSVCWLLSVLHEVMEVNSSKTLRLNINDSRLINGDYLKYDFSQLVVESPSLELIELTLCRHGVVGSWLETLKWEKQ
ncbi:uncharacterized protein LOC114951437 isoform X1 [Acropora millepora]|uniref:uncharacterized protein LOC114951437 isoform X1 n=1 Tax=Acropora millepora TaxID=45264 RepID=UPI001CF59F88|nr:uncharacterized protein LOC114951437 isoform X1 [Acropora millepora]XP_044175046.1 uncharacterized protein LOC114951437 isoform X1 [Acropora millepora]